MKALVLRAYGPPENLQIEERTRPEPGAGEVLVRVHTTAVNDWDWCLVRGRPYLYRALFGLRRPRVRVPGAELAGLVSAVGADVQQFEPGDAVYGDVSNAGFGGFAEYACVPETALARMPAGMSFEQAAATPHAGLLALQGLVDQGQLQRGERVLINGAGGGVGAAALQVSRHYDTEVTGVDATIKLEAMRALGFDHVIDYTQRDFAGDAGRYDLILDTRSSRSPWRCVRALAPRGRYVSVGGRIPHLLGIFLTAPLLSRWSDRSLQILALEPNRGLDRLTALLDHSGPGLPIDGPWDLDALPEAIAHFGAAEHVGKVVIRVAAD